MKRVTSILCSFLFLNSSNVLSQNPFYLFHYPLHTGDYWEYIYSPAFRETRKAIGDTLMPNGKLYRIVRQEVFGYTTFSFWRVSKENELFQIDQNRTEEYLRFKLNINLGDSWKYPVAGGDSSIFIVTEMGDTTLWSHQYKFAKIVDTRAFGSEYILVDSIGVFYEGFEGGKLELQGAIINGKQLGMITSVHSIEATASKNSLSIFQNYPNPFNSSTTFEYQLDSPSHVRISIFDVIGETVKILYDGFQTPGQHKINWNGSNDLGLPVSSGSYFYKLEVNGSINKSGRLSFLK